MNDAVVVVLRDGQHSASADATGLELFQSHALGDHQAAHRISARQACCGCSWYPAGGTTNGNTSVGEAFGWGTAASGMGSPWLLLMASVVAERVGRASPVIVIWRVAVWAARS